MSGAQPPTNEIEDARSIEVEDASTLYILLSDNEEYLSRSGCPIPTNAEIRLNFLENECARLADRRKGHSIKAVKNKLLFKWYRFGLRLHKNTEARLRRRAVHVKWAPSRKGEQAGRVHLRLLQFPAAVAERKTLPVCYKPLPKSKINFLDLSPEIRNQIYEEALLFKRPIEFCPEPFHYVGWLYRGSNGGGYTLMAERAMNDRLELIVYSPV
ncbi:hypothetical protein BST61_g2137 [Cercospora zeina]